MSDIFQRARELKEELTDFVLDAGGELAIALETFSADRLRGVKTTDLNQKGLLIDRFLIEGRIGGRSPIDLFLPTLESPIDRELVKNWRRGFIGLFAIEEKRDDGFRVMNWLTAKPYRVTVSDRTTLESMARYKIGEILVAMILPVTGEEWMFSGAPTTLGSLGKAKLAVAIGNFKENYPDYLYADAPDLLELSWESVERYHRDFVDFFGADEITLSGYELNKKLTDFQTKIAERNFESAGIDPSKSIGELLENAELNEEEKASIEESLKTSGATKTTKMVQPKIELPPPLKKAETVTVLADPRWGQVFLTNYHQMEKLLENLAGQESEESKKLIDLYLRSPEITYFVWEKLARRYPEALETLLRRTLDRPDFSLHTDLKLLLQEYGKPSEPRLPEIASVPVHLHDLFRSAYLEVSKPKTKISSKKTAKGFQK
ncbi:hypothetical protein V0288_18105 [Pannus brasiliensis CCIBt3594]|uniref:Uncharacterized protein n=1 Tax=Pannus brasiliensis CCIBt3594 TaxID=1427578 RepID=A0AAW9QUR3_9CHRO